MIEATLLAFALAMDAFAVALTQGARFRPRMGGGLAIALTFGVFQAVMPLIGWGIGTVALGLVESFDHWIAFGLLAFLGLRMLRGHGDDDDAMRRLTGTALLVSGVATSIDALAAGITLPALGVMPLVAVGLIGLVTFAMSGAGVLLGRRAGDHGGAWAERAGGVILIGLGVKILAEHSGWM